MREPNAFTTMPLVFPMSEKDKVDTAAIEWINDQLSDRQREIFDECGGARLQECWPEVMGAYLDAIAWMWVFSQQPHTRGSLQRELEGLVRKLAKHVYYLRTTETGGVSP